jgi:hypothetical protein
MGKALCPFMLICHNFDLLKYETQIVIQLMAKIAAKLFLKDFCGNKNFQHIQE